MSCFRRRRILETNTIEPQEIELFLEEQKKSYKDVLTRRQIMEKDIEVFCHCFKQISHEMGLLG